MDIEKEFLYEDNKENIENAIEIMIYFFIFFDIGIIIFSNCKFKSKNEGVKSLIDILCSFLFIDIVMKFINIRKIKDSISTFVYELFLSALSTAQFYLILASLENIFHATKVRKNLKFFDLMSIFPLSIIYFFLTFSYDKFFSIYQKPKIIFGVIQYITAIYCIYKLYELIKIKIIDIVNNSVKKKIIINTKLCLLILGSPLSAYILLITYYAIKICFLFIKNNLLFIYETIILKIFQEGSKYFIYLILMLFLYSLNEYNIKKEIIEKKSRNTDEEEKVIINN
jgi:hypothetical protein